MAKLSILGAQRVKALQEILDKQMKNKLKELEKEKVSDTRSQTTVVTNYFKKNGIDINEAMKSIEKLRNEFKTFYSDYYNQPRFLRDINGMSVSDFYNDSMREKPAEVVKYEAKRDKLISDFEEKKNALWLCETLEDAKEIVGIK